MGRGLDSNNKILSALFNQPSTWYIIFTNKRL